MDHRPEPLSDLSTEANLASKYFVDISQKGTVYQKRVNAERTAFGFPMLVGELPSAKVSNQALLPIPTTASGRRKTTRKRNLDDRDGGQPFSIEQLLQRCRRRGYVCKVDAIKGVDERVYQEKQLKDPSDRSYKDAEDISIFLEKLNSKRAVKEFLGMCCTIPRLAPSRAVSCKVNGCPILIDIGIKCWEYKSTEERIVICHKCYASKKVGEYISVKAQKYSPWNNEWVFTEKLKSEFKAIKLQQDNGEGEHTVVCLFCRNAHHAMCVKYEPYNWQTACEKYCKDFGENFRPRYICKICMRKLAPNARLPETPAVLFHPEDLLVTELTLNMETDLLKFYFDQTQDGETKLYVRQVSSRKGIFEALPRMKKELEKNDRVSQWKYIRRSIVVFQQRPGAEYPIALFNMIVYEYPETSSVNLSYLDSVKLFEPSDIRRKFYQRCVLSYLREVSKWYRMLYFWVCPPSPGDEYVFYGRPTETIDSTLAGLPENGLFRWYKEILETGKEQNIVEEFLQAGETNPYEDEFLDAPYFLDDFWPNRFETILADYEKEMTEYQAAVNNRTTKSRQRSARAKKTQQNGPPPSINDRFLESVKGCNDSLFVVHLKNLVKITENDRAAFENEPDVLCSYMSNRDNFIVNCRENKFDFSTTRRGEYATLIMNSKIAQESRNKKCIECEKIIREGVYCYKCPAQENKVFCLDCSTRHEHKDALRYFKVPFFEDPKDEARIFKRIMKHLKAEGNFIAELSYELCAPLNKRRDSSEEFKKQAEIIRLHVAALNSVDDKVHQQTNCRACAAAWFPLIRHKEFCKGKACSVPSCTSLVPFDNNGIIHSAVPIGL